MRRLHVAALAKGLRALCLWALGLWAVPLWGEVWFSGLDLTAFDRLLFQAEADSPGFGSYKTLFAAELPEGRLQQLTFFPERAALVAGALQVEKPEELPASFQVVLHVPILPPVKVSLRKAYEQQIQEEGTRVGCAFVS